MEIFSSEKKRRHEYFSKILQRRAEDLQHIHRIILIGTGESGKSTFVKQMKLLSSPNQSFPESYRVKFIPEIYRNVVQSLASIVTFMEGEKLSFATTKAQDAKMKEVKRLILDIKVEIDRVPDSIISYCSSSSAASDKRLEFFKACNALWTDDGVQRASRRGNEFQLIDCAQYFLDKLNDLAEPSFKPSDEDVLMCRTKTLGIHTETIVFNGVQFELVDVGGQRDQRAKWIEAMSDGVTAVIFLTDVSAYDVKLAEDVSVNRLRDSIGLLGQVWKNNLLSDKSIILFLNKQDRLEGKLRLGQGGQLDSFFPEYAKAKLTFLLTLLRDIKSVRGVKNRKESEVWDKHFVYFMPTSVGQRRSSIIRQSTASSDSHSQSKDAQLVGEYGQIQSLVGKAFADNLVDQWLTSSVSQLEVSDDFNAFSRRLHSIAFYQLVCITDFLQKQFVDQCVETAGRRIYAFPTTAIDKRNVGRVFDACKEILQGKAIKALIA